MKFKRTALSETSNSSSIVALCFSATLGRTPRSMPNAGGDADAETQCPASEDDFCVNAAETEQVRNFE